MPLRIIDVSPFLFMSRHHYETARRRLFEVVDIMRKDKGIVVLVFDVLKMLKWRYAREPFASVCERFVEEHPPAPNAGEPGAPSIRGPNMALPLGVIPTAAGLILIPLIPFLLIRCRSKPSLPTGSCGQGRMLLAPTLTA